MQIHHFVEIVIASVVVKVLPLGLVMGIVIIPQTIRSAIMMVEIAVKFINGLVMETVMMLQTMCYVSLMVEIAVHQMLLHNIAHNAIVLPVKILIGLVMDIVMTLQIIKIVAMMVEIAVELM